MDNKEINFPEGKQEKALIKESKGEKNLTWGKYGEINFI